MNEPRNLPFQTALVTGASGFIGSALARRLTEMGVTVTGAATRSRDGLDPTLRWTFGDLADSRYVAQLLDQNKPEVIFHLASYVKGTRDREAMLPAFHSNLESTVNLLTLAQYPECRRIVLTGSLEEPEGEDPIPSSPYAAAKWAASGYARMFHALYDTPVVIARLFMVYGPDQKDVNKLIPYVIRSFLAGETPSLSSGVRQVDWIYVDDVVDGYLALAAASGIEGETLDIGSGTLVTIREVVEEIRKQMNPAVILPWGSMQDRPMERIRMADVESTMQKIGWQPKTSLRDGLAQTIAWYRKNAQRAER